TAARRALVVLRVALSRVAAVSREMPGRQAKAARRAMGVSPSVAAPLAVAAGAESAMALARAESTMAAARAESAMALARAESAMAATPVVLPGSAVRRERVALRAARARPAAGPRR